MKSKPAEVVNIPPSFMRVTGSTDDLNLAQYNDFTPVVDGNIIPAVRFTLYHTSRCSVAEKDSVNYEKYYYRKPVASHRNRPISCLGSLQTNNILSERVMSYKAYELLHFNTIVL